MPRVTQTMRDNHIPRLTASAKYTSRISTPQHSSNPVRESRPHHSKAHHDNRPRRPDSPPSRPRRSIQGREERTDDDRTDRASETHCELDEPITFAEGRPRARACSRAGPSGHGLGQGRGVSFDEEYCDARRDLRDFGQCEDESEADPDADIGWSRGPTRRLGMCGGTSAGERVEQGQECKRDGPEVHTSVVRHGVVEST